jgi:hypothetical protein
VRHRRHCEATRACRGWPEYGARGGDLRRAEGADDELGDSKGPGTK